MKKVKRLTLPSQELGKAFDMLKLSNSELQKLASAGASIQMKKEQSLACWCVSHGAWCGQYSAKG